MTIRVTCDQCGSVLKVKDELAGTDGKCPKCKKKFVVPQPGADVDEPGHSAADDGPAPEKAKAPDPGKAPAAKPAKPAPAAVKKSAKDDDFDPVSFLMEEGPKKRAARFDPGPDDDDAPRGRNSASSGPGLSLDDDGDDPAPPPPKRWGARKDSTTAADAASRSLGGGGGTGNTARDLLAKSMEESRVRATEMPPEEPRFVFDWQGFFREFGLKIGGLIGGTVVGVVLLYTLVNSMMTDKLSLPELGYLEGKVTYQGKPQPGITVYFSPVDAEIKNGKKGQKARSSTGLTDENGDYTLYYIKGIEGVKVGLCRVSLESTDLTFPIPADYSVRGTKTFEVSKGTNKPYNIDLK